LRRMFHAIHRSIHCARGSNLCGFIAPIQASNGKFYRYPMTIRFIQ
jgi:uncharacterized Tic20 family protein